MVLTNFLSLPESLTDELIAQNAAMSQTNLSPIHTKQNQQAGVIAPQLVKVCVVSDRYAATNILLIKLSFLSVIWVLFTSNNWKKSGSSARMF